METVRWWVLGASLVLIVIYAAGSGSWVASGDEWYRSLVRPPWQPPDMWFGIAWTYNFTMLAIVSVQVARRASHAQMVTWVAALAVSVAFALGWAYLFYVQHALAWSAVSLILAALATVPLVIAAWGSAAWAGAVLLPYLAWLCIAASLAVGYTTRNG